MSAQPRPDLLRWTLLGGAALVLLAAEPIALDEPLFTAGYVVRAALLPLYSALALLFLALAPSAAQRFSPLVLAAALLPAVIALWSLRAPSAIDSEGVWRGAACLGSLAALPLAWQAQGRERLTPELLLRTLLGAGVVAALLTLVGALLGGEAVGPFGRAGVAGAVFAALLPVALCCPLSRRVSLHALAFAVLLAALLATQSRTAVVAGLIATAVSLAVGAATPARRRRLRLVTAALIVAAVLALAAALNGWIPVPGSQRTLQVRLGLYRGAITLIEEAPVLGVGLGGYAAAGLRARDVEEARLEPGRRAFHAHNDYLHVAVEGGVPALALLLSWWVCVLAFLARDRAAGAWRGSQAGAMGMLVALGVAGLGDGVLIDPAPVLLAAAGAYSALCGQAMGVVRVPGLVLRLAGAALAVVLIALGAVLARYAVADHALMRYVTERARAPFGTPATRWLTDVALTWRADHPRALRLLGVERAQQGKLALARDSFREALRADGALTEARLDLAQAYGLEGRTEDALAALREAAMHDSRRYEIYRRQAELLAGPESVPGDPVMEFDAVAVRRVLNEAAERASWPYLAAVDDGWFWRRRNSLQAAGGALRQAGSLASEAGVALPAELLYESFRLAEWEDRAPEFFIVDILVRALAANPAPAVRIRAEAERFLDEGERRVEAAREALQGEADRLDMRAADRAFSAAAIRFTALLAEGVADPGEMLRLAQQETQERRFRRALARYRSLLAWTLPGSDALVLRGSRALEAMARQADLLIEAAQVAARVDAGLARHFFAQGHLRLGMEQLARGETQAARARLERLVADEPEMAEAAYALARCQARLGEGSAAARSLCAALDLNPGLATTALAEPDFALLRSTDVRVRQSLALSDD